MMNPEIVSLLAEKMESAIRETRSKKDFVADNDAWKYLVSEGQFKIPSESMAVIKDKAKDSRIYAQICDIVKEREQK